MTDYDTTQKLERTDRGFRFTIESTRGTGTRDQDKIKAELRTEDIPDFSRLMELNNKITDVMNARRTHHPDEDGDSDE